MATVVGVVDGGWNNHRCGGGDGTPENVYHPGANLPSEGFFCKLVRSIPNFRSCVSVIMDGSTLEWDKS